MKDLGSCDIYPGSLVHSPNGRFVAVCGDGEYIIYTALAWRNKSYGSALSFVWGEDSNTFATRDSTSIVRWGVETRHTLGPSVCEEKPLHVIIGTRNTAVKLCFGMLLLLTMQKSPKSPLSLCLRCSSCSLEAPVRRKCTMLCDSPVLDSDTDTCQEHAPSLAAQSLFFAARWAIASLHLLRLKHAMLQAAQELQGV